MVTRGEDDEAEAVCHAGDRRNVNQCVSQGNFPNSERSEIFDLARSHSVECERKSD